MNSTAPLVPHQAYVDEARRIQESAEYSAQGQFEAAKAWRASNWVLGGCTTAASGVAGVLTFASDGLQTLSGILALTAAVTAAVHATLRPDKKSEKAQTSANEYLAIQSAARRLALLDIPAASINVRTRLEALADRAEAVNKSADAIPKFAYNRGKKNIERGSQAYAVDGK